MINAIIEAVSIALYEKFGYENHMEEIEQDLKEPCFFISCLNPTTKLFFGKRYFRQNQFCIQYFPESKNKKHECNEVAEQLTWLLEDINVSDTVIRGTKMRYEVIDDVLNFFVNYDCFVYKMEDKTKMETMKSNANMKRG